MDRCATSIGCAECEDRKRNLADQQAVQQSEVEFTANNPGASLFHCHQQNHMDLGFMMLFNYA
jgi:FtsP/CotA-like multicopper oxidase with cupredoxin domain